MIEKAKQYFETIQFIKKNWYNPLIIFIIIIIIFSPILGILYFNFEISLFFQLKFIIKVLISSILSLTIFIIWFFTTKIPKTIKGHIGIVISITIENDKIKNKLKYEFIDKLKSIISKDTHQYFDFIVLSDYHANRFNNNSIKYIYKIKGHFYLYGYFCIRNHQSQKCYYLNLKAAVKHFPILKQVSDQFRDVDIKKAFKNDFIIPSSNEIIEFKHTTDNVSFASKYIMGIASYLSLDMITAFDLHYNLINEINIKKIDEEIFSHIKTRLPLFIINESMNLSYLYYHKYNDIEKMNYYTDIILKFDENNYYSKLSKSIYYFLKNRDIKSSLEILNTIKDNIDSTWLYNKAFLLAYDNKLYDSYIVYKKATLGNIAGSTINESEDFILKILEKEPDKYQLNLCLGLIYFFDKKDYDLSKEYLLKFKEESLKRNRNLKVINIVDKIIKKMEKSS